MSRVAWPIATVADLRAALRDVDGAVPIVSIFDDPAHDEACDVDGPLVAILCWTERPSNAHAIFIGPDQGVTA